MLNGAIANVETTFEWIELLKSKLLNSLECRFDYVEKSDVLVASTFLDFRYKTLGFIEDEHHRLELRDRVFKYLHDLHDSLSNKNNTSLPTR